MVTYLKDLHETDAKHQKRCFNRMNPTSITILHAYLGILPQMNNRLYLKTSNMHSENESEGFNTK